MSTLKNSFCGNRVETARALEAKAREVKAAKAREVKAAKAREVKAAKAREMADKKKKYASKAFAEALRLREEAAKLEAQRQWVAATALQAWTRGVCTRRAIIELEKSRDMPGVDAVRDYVPCIHKYIFIN